MKNNKKILPAALFFLLIISGNIFAQDAELELVIDASSATKPKPQVFNPGVDLGGRGFSRDSAWPGELAAQETINAWSKEIGFGGVNRIQYNLWEISDQKKISDSYEQNIKKISDAGGIVILNIFGMPKGMGRVLDKRSMPKNPGAFKEHIKGIIRDLSCNKKYNIWYEVWSAPDLETFFIGRQEEYLILYRIFAEAVHELEKETKTNIPLGGPSVSAWFANTENNTVATPERSLVYELIKFCYRYKLPLDFISWHAYSSNAQPELAGTIYNKNPVQLIRNWLKYFGFSQDTPIIIDEWNFDLNKNMAVERSVRAFIAASFIPARLDKMNAAGIDRQVYFALEDFQNNKENVDRNIGVFSFDSESSSYDAKPKPAFNVFKMLKMLGADSYALNFSDPFVGVIATKSEDALKILIYYYIDPLAADSYMADNISSLNSDERGIIVAMVKSGQLQNILLGQDDITALHTTNRIKAFLKAAKDALDLAKKAMDSSRKLKLNIRGLKDNYSYERYTVDSSCSSNCDFSPKEEKELPAADILNENLTLNPYSVHLIILNKKPQPQAVQAAQEQPATPQ
jgi:hypothetical protein